MRSIESFPKFLLVRSVCFTVLFAIVFAAFACDAKAQNLPDAPRIVSRLDESRLSVLKGNTPPQARAEFDRGRVAPNLPMGDLVLVLRRSPERQAAFDAFLASQQDSTSPNYHRWLTPSEIGEQFGPAETDLDTLVSWLQNRGFRIDSVAKDRMTIRFSGEANQVASAFHTEIHNLEVRGEAHIANMSDPSIPEALTPVVVGIKSLNNFFAHPLHVRGAAVRRNGETGKWERISNSPEKPVNQVPEPKNSRQVQPLFNTGGTSSGVANIEDIGPYDFATIYNVLPLWNASTPIDGTGQKIAIAGTSDVNLNDVATFRSAFGLPVVGSKYPTYKAPVIIDTNTPPGDCSNNAASCSDDEYENSLDVEWSGAIAKNAQIILVASSAPTSSTDPLYLSEHYIVENVTAPVMSVSYGECELGLGTAGNAEYSNLWSTAQMAGIAVFVASGDQGAASCDAGFDTSVPYGSQYGLSVSGFASTPYNTAVGGTDFNWGWTNVQSNYWNTANSSTTLSSAKGYIPEFPWNNTCTNPLLDSLFNSQLHASLSAAQMCDEIGTGQITSSGGSLYGLVDTVGGSGGRSACTTNDGNTVASCKGGYPKPTWQTGVTGIPADGMRDIPDVSFFAANGFSGSAYVVCVSIAGNCSYTAGTEPVGEEVGGTSASSPIMAGVMALVNQKAGTPQGNPNKLLYQLAAKESYSGCKSESVGLSGSSCVFNDIDTGIIAMPCDVGSPNCSGTNVYGVQTGYAATPGYDLATGLGSINVANLVNAIPAASGPGVTLSAPLTFASTTIGATTAAQIVTITNSGNAALTLTSETITGAAASSFVKSATTCAATLAAAASCTVSVEFKPTAAGTLSASLSIADNATGSPQSVTLTGVGVAPVITVSLSPASLSFASTVVGTTSAAQLVTIKNTSPSSAVTLTSETIVGTGASAFVKSATTCGATLAASASCTVSVEFKPTVAGAFTASLSVADNATGTPQTVALSGTAQSNTPTVTLTPTQIAFPGTEVGTTSSAQVVVLQNTSAASVSISSIALGGTSASSFVELGTCGATLAANASCSLYVAFAPATATALTGTLTITDNASGSPHTVTLSGTGIAVPTLKLSTTAVSFPNTAHGTVSAATAVTLTNSGAVTLDLYSIAITGTNPAAFAELNTCGPTLAPAASCTVYVAFKPAAAGAFKATLSITDNGSASPQSVALTGTGN